MLPTSASTLPGGNIAIKALVPILSALSERYPVTCNQPRGSAGTGGPALGPGAMGPRAYKVLRVFVLGNARPNRACLRGRHQGGTVLTDVSPRQFRRPADEWGRGLASRSGLALACGCSVSGLSILLHYNNAINLLTYICKIVAKRRAVQSRTEIPSCAAATFS